MVAIKRLQPAAWTLSVIFGMLALSTSTGCPIVEPWGERTAITLWGVFHPLVIVIGLVFGLLTTVRARQADRERWRVVDDSVLTSGEREYAHSEAEAAKKAAGVAFVVTPMTVGLWLAYQLKGDELGAADFLTVTPLFGFVLGLGVGLLRARLQR